MRSDEAIRAWRLHACGAMLDVLHGNQDLERGLIDASAELAAVVGSRDA